MEARKQQPELDEVLENELLPEEQTQLRGNSSNSRFEALDLTNHPSLKYPVIFRRSIWSEGPLCLLLGIFIVLSALFSLRFPVTIELIPLDALGLKQIALPIPLLGFIPLLLAIVLAHRLFDAVYIIDREYVRSLHGFLSLRKHDVRLEYQDLRGVEIDRGIYGRIVNTGDLKIWSLMPSEVELLLSGVRDPSSYRDLIISNKKERAFRG
ncbi:MAG: hypothetical protein KDD42_05015 [Bdellovibrionales bacterium]|nr:hypothetical protein [Bdellovibrionales bacterium]